MTARKVNKREYITHEIRFIVWRETELTLAALAECETWEELDASIFWPIREHVLPVRLDTSDNIDTAILTNGR